MNNISINLDLTKIPEWFETKEYNQEFSDLKKTIDSINEFVRKFKYGIESRVYNDEYFNEFFLNKLECFKDKVSNKIKSDRSSYGNGGIFLYGEVGGAHFYKMVEAIDRLLEKENTDFRMLPTLVDSRQVKQIKNVNEKVLNDLLYDGARVKEPPLPR
jgi:hypothetical protein